MAKKVKVEGEGGGRKVGRPHPKTAVVEEAKDEGRYLLDQYEACDKQAVEELAEKFEDNRAYFEKRIEALNRRACLHKSEPCAVRARAEITGMLTVLNALGFEAVGNWKLYYRDFTLMPAEWIAEEGGAK